MALTYDPLATNPANYIVNELQVVGTDAAIYPVEHPFYLIDFQMWGTAVADSIEVELNYLLEYSLSPLFTSRSNVTGREVHSYIVLLKPELWSDVRISYRGVGGDLDTDLEDEIVAAVGFDRTDPSTWLDFHGEFVAKLPSTNSIDTPKKSVTERLALMTDKVINQLKRPQFLLSDPASIVARDNSILTDEKASLALANSLLALEIVLAPTINFPTEGFTNYINNDAITTDNMVTSNNYQGEHTASDWEIYLDSDLSTLIDSSYNDEDVLVNWYPSGLVALSFYYVRCRHRSDNHISKWSTVIKFITDPSMKYIQTPSITSPTEGSINISPLPVLQSDTFVLVNGTGSHLTTDWQVSDIADFSNIIYQAINSPDLVSHDVATELGDFNIVFARCRYNSSDDTTSGWSDGVSFTTGDLFEAIRLIESDSEDEFNGITFDSATGNYVVVGYSGDSSGAGNRDCYIATFNPSLTLIDHRMLGVFPHDEFNNVIVDPNTNNYICVGYSDGDYYIAIFDNTLTLINDKLITNGVSNEEFNDIIFDPNTNNYVCVGAGLGKAYIAIFDSSLTLVNDRLSTNIFSTITIYSVIVNNNDEFILAGTLISGGNRDGYIMVFDSSLNFLGDKIIGNSLEQHFFSIIQDNVTNNYVCVGRDTTSVLGGFITILDSNFIMLSGRFLSGNQNQLNTVIKDPNSGNYVCVGSAIISGSRRDGQIIIFDSSLNIVESKILEGDGGSNIITFNDIVIDPITGNYVAVGRSLPGSVGGALIITFLKNLTTSNGVIPNITGLSIANGNQSTTTVTPYTTDDISVGITNPTATETSPSLTETSPSLTETFSNY